MKFRGSLRGAFVLTVVSLSLVGLCQDAQASQTIVEDNLEANPTDWALYFTQGASLAYHYSNNAALARSGTGVTILSGYTPGNSPAMWKIFDTANPTTAFSCGVAVYLKKVYSPTQQVRLNLVDVISNTYLAQKTVSVTSSSYTLFSLNSPGSCQPWTSVGIELISTGPSAGVLVDDVTFKRNYL